MTDTGRGVYQGEILDHSYSLNDLINKISTLNNYFSTINDIFFWYTEKNGTKYGAINLIFDKNGESDIWNGKLEYRNKEQDVFSLTIFNNHCFGTDYQYCSFDLDKFVKDVSLDKLCSVSIFSDRKKIFRIHNSKFYITEETSGGSGGITTVITITNDPYLKIDCNNI